MSAKMQAAAHHSRGQGLSILYVTACGEAGVAEYVHSLAEGMSKLGASVTVLGPRGSRFAESISRLTNVRFIGIPLRKKPHPVWDIYCSYKIWQTMRKGDFDIVHSNSSKAGFLTAIARVGVRRTKFVYSPHCTSASLIEVTPLAQLYFILERWAARRHDLLMACCRAEYLQLLQTKMGKNGNAVSIYHGVEIQSVSRRAEHYRKSIGLGRFPLIGTAVRLVPQKGLDNLIMSLEYVVKRFPHTRLAIAGDGPIEAELRALTRKVGVEDRVHFLGYVEDCDAFLASLDLFVLPSRWEAFPFALLRAGAVGAPVVVSDVGGVSEIIDESTGWLVPPNDVERLAVAMIEALSEKQEAAKRATKLRERVMENHKMADMVQKTLDAYYLEIGVRSDGVIC